MRYSLDDNQELTKYLEGIADHTLLTRQEEHDLALIWFKRHPKRKPSRKQLQAREALFEHNMKLVVSIAKNYRNRGLPFIEVIQEGVTGLARALETYDPTKGNRLSTYATWWIRQACQRAVAQQGATIRVPAHVNFRRARAYEIWEKRPNATIEEIAEELECKPHHIEEALDVVRATYSLNHTNEDGDVTGIADSIADPHSDDPADIAEATDFLRARDIHSALARIEEEERAVLELRFGFGGTHAHSFAEISTALKIPSHRAQQIQKTALRKLGNILESDGLLSPDGPLPDRTPANTSRSALMSMPLLDEDVDTLAQIAEFMRSHDLAIAAEDVDTFIENIISAHNVELIDEPVLGRCDCSYESCIQEPLNDEEIAC